MEMHCDMKIQRPVTSAARSQRPPRTIRVLSCLLACLLVSACGCGGRGIELVEVSGYVTLDGKAPPAGGTIVFTPYEALSGEPLRPTQSQFGEDGFFRPRAFDDASGLVPAKYRVAVHCWEIAPSMGGPPAKSHIPEKYCNASTSGLELTVPSGAGSITWNAELIGNPQ